MSMQRFLLFGGDTYYAGGGWNDYLDSYDDAEAAKAEGERRADEDSDRVDWWQVVDTKAKPPTIIASDGYAHT